MLRSFQEEKETGSGTNQSQGGAAEKKAGKGFDELEQSIIVFDTISS